MTSFTFTSPTLERRAGASQLGDSAPNRRKGSVKADQALRQVPAGLFLSKAYLARARQTLIIDNIATCYLLSAMVKAAQIVSPSRTNELLGIFERLHGIYQQRRKKFLVVIREHSVETEISIYRLDEVLKMKSKTVSTRAPPPSINATINIPNLAVA
jgi:hypothetical protein